MKIKDFKKAYIDMRNEKIYDINFFFQYYLNEGGKATDPNEFTENFLYTHTIQPTPPGFPQMKIRTGEVDKEAILNHMDGVFDLIILKSKEGNFIKAIG